MDLRTGAFVLTALLAVAGVPRTSPAASSPVRLVSSSETARDRFGTCVAASGSTVAVVAPFDNSGRGLVHVFVRDGAGWPEQQRIGASGYVYAYDSPVAVSGDTLAVGSVVGDLSGNLTGSVQVFTRSGGAWTLQQKLGATGGSSTDNFGAAVALDGDTLVVAASADDEAAANAGAAYVFVRSGTTWTQQQKLMPPAVAASGSGQFGNSVGVSGDTVVAGAPFRGATGAALVFTRSGGTWTQQQELTASNAPDAEDFGHAVAVSGDTLVVGGRYDGADEDGAAYVFERTGTAWTQAVRLTASDAAPHHLFGDSVGIDGTSVVVGAPSDFGAASILGAAYLFTRSGAGWSEQAKLTVPGAPNYLGGAVAISGDVVVAGATGGEAASAAGQAFVIESADGPGPSGPIEGFIRPASVTVRPNARDAAKSTVTVTGLLDAGPGAPDFSGPATLDIGGLHEDVPAWVPKGRALTHRANGFAVSVTPGAHGSSGAKFSLKYTGDLTGKVAADGPLTLRVRSDSTDAVAGVTLTSGRFRLGAGTAALADPEVFIVSAKATVRGAGRDTLALTLGFAGGGDPPAEASDLTIGFGGTFSATVPKSAFGRSGARHVFAGDAGGIRKAIVDHARGLVVVTGRALDLGTFAPGGNPVVVTLGLGGRTHAVAVRTGLTGAALRY